jgi:hypothetical protein
MSQLDLPFDLVTFPLTEEQVRLVAPLVRRQAEDRRGLLFVSVAPNVQDGSNVFTFQAKFLPWRKANRVLKIIREVEEVAKVAV